MFNVLDNRCNSYHSSYWSLLFSPNIPLSSNVPFYWPPLFHIMLSLATTMPPTSIPIKHHIAPLILHKFIAILNIICFNPNHDPHLDHPLPSQQVPCPIFNWEFSMQGITCHQCSIFEHFHDYFHGFCY